MREDVYEAVERIADVEAFLTPQGSAALIFDSNACCFGALQHFIEVVHLNREIGDRSAWTHFLAKLIRGLVRTGGAARKL